MKGELVPADLVLLVQGDMVTRFRTRILAIPTKAAHELLGISDLVEAQTKLKHHVYEALRELSEYNPADYGIDTTYHL